MDYRLIKYNKKGALRYLLKRKRAFISLPSSIKRARAYLPAKIVRSRDAQCNSEESQLDYELEISHLCPGLNASIV